MVDSRKNIQRIWDEPSRQVVPTGWPLDEITSFASEWLVWQLMDSAFPTGAFSHSNGLEAAWQLGAISSREDLFAFCSEQLEQQAEGMLAFVREGSETTNPLAQLDSDCHAFLINPIANRASRLQGQALVVAAEKCLGMNYLNRVRQEWSLESSGHLAPWFGRILASAGIRYSMAGRMYLFGQMRGTISAAVRLNVIGPFEGQNLQRKLAPFAEACWTRCAQMPLHQIAQTSPWLELWQANHEFLYSRLFQS